MDWNKLYKEGKLTIAGEDWANERDNEFDENSTIDDKLQLEAPAEFIQIYKEYLEEWADICCSAILGAPFPNKVT